MSGFALNGPVELSLPAQAGMMLVLRLTTAGVMARAGLSVDKLDDVKLAVEEACNCFLSGAGAPETLRLRFEARNDCLHISVCGEGGRPVCLLEGEREIVRCILEALSDGVEISEDGDVLTGIALRVVADA